LLPRKESPIENQTLTPIITGGVAIAVLVALSRTRPPKPEPPAPKPLTNKNLTASFIAAIPEITPEINLELATATQTETFTQTSSRVLWGLFDLGTSTVQIRVPVTYRYHLCLREPWRLEIDGHRVIVQAPMFRPSLPPAIHTDKLEKMSVRGWGRGSTAELMEQTQKEITPMLNRQARDPRHLELVRGQCRRSVAEFVKLWLERESHWGRPVTEIQVMFPGEPALTGETTLQLGNNQTNQ
jgi:hypothetical protein